MISLGGVKDRFKALSVCSDLFFKQAFNKTGDWIMSINLFLYVQGLFFFLLHHFIDVVLYVIDMVCPRSHVFVQKLCKISKVCI